MKLRLLKYMLLLIFLIVSSAVYSQKIIVEKIKLTETIDKKYVSEIPKVRDLTNSNNGIVDIINNQILERFMINSFIQKELEEFRWYEVECSSEIKGNILYISFNGEYHGPYPSYVEDEFFFDLKSGELLTKTIIPFQALFTLTGYLDFLNKYWLNGVKKEFKTAIECAEYEPYCSYYDIDNYTVKNRKLSISLVNDCYAHVSQACSPSYSISVELDSVRKYLNDLGIFILIESNNSSKSPIEKLIENEKLKDHVEKNVFLFGRIDDKYPVSIAINIDNQKVSGYYYYDKKLQKLTLKGIKQDNVISLTETFDNQLTGFMEFTESTDYDPQGFYLYNGVDQQKYVTGIWMNADKTKTSGIKFTEIKTSAWY